MLLDRFYTKALETNTYSKVVGGVPKRFTPPETNYLWEAFATWNRAGVPVIVKYLFDYNEDEYLIMVLFPKIVMGGELSSYKDKEGNIIVDVEDFFFSWSNTNAFIDVQSEEIHSEPMTLFKFAIGIDNILAQYLSFGRDKEEGLYLNIPKELNFFTKYDSALHF